MLHIRLTTIGLIRPVRCGTNSRFGSSLATRWYPCKSFR